MSCSEALITRKSGQGPDLRVLDFGVAVLWKLSCLPGKKPCVAGDVSSSFLMLIKEYFTSFCQWRSVQKGGQHACLLGSISRRGKINA